MTNPIMQALAVVPSRRDVRTLEHRGEVLSRSSQVRVRSLDVGLCGTDREICAFSYGTPPEGYEYLILGHESLGQVVEVGEEVSRFKPGDLVVPIVRRPCEHDHCVPCRDSRQDFCSTGDYVERGIKSCHGFLIESFVEHEAYLNPVPPGLRDVAVLVEPLSIAEKGIAQIRQAQNRLPWLSADAREESMGAGKRAVVVGAGPVGILGTMLLLTRGFETWVYSRSKAPNSKADLVESLGARYVSSLDATPAMLAERVGNIDLVYEAAGISQVAYDVLEVLGLNGAFIFTGLPTHEKAANIKSESIMMNLVLKNQLVLGTVNAPVASYESAIRDLEIFNQRWPEALRSIITGRHRLSDSRRLLLDKPSGIKNVISFD